MKCKDYLLEKTFSIGADVDFLYKKFFMKHIKNFNSKNGFQKFIDGLPKNNLSKPICFGEISSDKLKSKQCKKAYSMNPVIINAGIYSSGNFYNMQTKIIQLSLNLSALNLIKGYITFNKDDFMGEIGTAGTRVLNEFSEGSIKGSIYHELSHWLDDTLHNEHLIKSLKRVTGNVNLSTFEKDAQIHSIKQLKRSIGKKNWETTTWIDIIEKKPSFHVLFQQLNTLPKKIVNDYMKSMLKRLKRENLLGQGLINTFKDGIKFTS